MTKRNCIRLFFILSLIIIDSSRSYAQNPEIENLIKQSKSGKEDTSKIFIYQQISIDLLYIEPHRARFYAEKALHLSGKFKHIKYTASSLNIIAQSYLEENEDVLAIDFYKKSIPYFETLNDFQGLALVYNDLGLIFYKQGQYLFAIESYNKAISYFDQSNDRMGASDAFVNLGVVAMKQGDFQNSIESFIKALKIKEELQDNEGIARAKGNLANLYRDQNNYDRALVYYFQSLELFQVLEDKYGEGSTLTNIGIAYKNQKKYKEALSYHQQSLDIFIELNSKLGMGSCYSNLGSVYNDQMNFELSLENNKKALKIFKELENKEAMCGRYIEIGSVLTKMASYEQAYFNLQEGLNIAKEIGNKGRELESYNYLYEYYLALKNYKTSLEYYKVYSEVKDSVFNIEKSQQLAEIQTKYEIDKKEQENEILRKDQAVKNALISKKSFENNVLISGVLVFLIFTGYFYFHNVQKKKINALLSQQNDEINIKQAEIIKINADLQKSQSQLYKVNKSLQKLNIGLESLVKERTAALQQINEELDTFLYQSSHALRRPIVTVMGLLQIARMEKNKKCLEDIYSKIDNTANRMDLMLRKLVMVSEINFSKNEVEFVNFEVIINEIWASLSSTLNCGNMNLLIKAEENLNYMADRKLIYMMLENIIENSIMYHIEENNHVPFLEISIKSKPTTVNIDICDNGIGIPEQAIGKVFEMFTVANDAGKGFGLGLYIVKKSVQKLKGTISVETAAEKNTIFKISLPKQNVSIG